MTDRRGAVVLLTGAAGGIGRAIAHRYARDGAALVLADVDEGGLEDLAGDLARSAAADVLTVAFDLGDEEACARCVQAAVARFGRVDVLVNNAGITHLGSVVETRSEVFRRVMEVNFFGAVAMTKAVLPPMMAQRAGHVAVLSSIAGVAPLIGRSGYAASKHALHGFFGSLRGEVAEAGIGVTLVCPTFTRTGIGAGALGPDGGPAGGRRTETGVLLDPADVAEAVHRGVRRSRRLVVVGRTGKAAYLLARFAPALYERLMLRRLANFPP